MNAPENSRLRVFPDEVAFMDARLQGILKLTLDPEFNALLAPPLGDQP